MPSRSGHLRITNDRFELWLLDDRGTVVEVSLELDADAAARLRATASRHGHAVSCHGGARRSLMQRALHELGGIPTLEVHHGHPPRFVLALAGPWGRRELDLDLVEVAELVIAGRMAITAIGWPSRDWDAELALLARDRTRRDGAPSDGLPADGPTDGERGRGEV